MQGDDDQKAGSEPRRVRLGLGTLRAGLIGMLSSISAGNFSCKGDVEPEFEASRHLNCKF